jgi:triphosphoribosyl-dephospho-CoA synthase
VSEARQQAHRGILERVHNTERQKLQQEQCCELTPSTRLLRHRLLWRCVTFYTTLIRLFRQGTKSATKLVQLELSKEERIAQNLELAILLEVSAHKPGNVSIVTDFENTRYEHFLASAVASLPSFRYAASQGIAFSEGRIPLSKTGVGNIIKDCINRISLSQNGGNTLLGAVLLLSPMAIAAGMSRLVKNRFVVENLREELKQVVENTTPEDAVNVYEAIRIAKPSGLRKVPELDVNEPDSISKIRSTKVSLYDVFKIASDHDMICSEWTSNFTLIFDFAYPSLKTKLQSIRDVNSAVIQTFLEVLSEYPDTFIARKAGIKRAREISSIAKEVLRAGGMETIKGRKKLAEFDELLRKGSNLLNPGTTADITCAALALCILGGFRP